MASVENENGGLKRLQMKAPLVLSGSSVVYLRVLTGREVFGAELQRHVTGRRLCGSIVPKRATSI